MRRVLFALLVGLGGAAILLALGTWQLQRLAWKEGLIAEIDARIDAEPVALPAGFEPDADRYLPVSVTGTFAEAPAARMLASRRQTGAVYRVLRPFTAQNGVRLMVDLGWIPAEADVPPAPDGPVTLTGNLDWPNETDGFTPAPDLSENLWYARDVAPLAEAYETEPVLLVLRDVPDGLPEVTAWPVDTGNIPNDHLPYAITWFSLAAIWIAMTVYFVTRRPARHAGEG